jgi:hypothetical protein
MSVLTCPEMENLIDLHAAGACDAVTGARVRAHLAGCPDCARAHREAQQLQGMLDAHYRTPDALRRLHERLDAEASPRRRPARGLPRAQRIAALAALVLLSVGLAWLMRPAGSDGLPGDDSVALLWASPDARWSGSGAAGVELEAGELWLRARPGGGSVKVRTQAGEVSAEAGECFVAADPRGRQGEAARVRVAVRAGSVRVANANGKAEARTGEVVMAWADEAPRRQVEALALRLGRLYVPVPVESTGRIPTRRLPIDLAEVTNYRGVAKALALDDSAAEKLRANGFVVLPGGQDHDLLAAYRRLRGREVPLVITADSLLHRTRAHLDDTLRSVEERILLPDLETLTAALLRTADQSPVPAGSADWQAARQLAMDYLAVGLRALRPDAPLPPDVDREAVAEALAAMRAGAGPVRLRLLGRTVDFRSSRPQGHYARSERLKGYHAALTWFSRVGLLLEGGPGRPVSADEARRQTLAAALLTDALARAELPDPRKAAAVWERTYTVTAFFTGLADDLGPLSYREALARSGCAPPHLGRLTEAARLLALKLELARQTPDLRRKPVAPGTPANLLDRLDRQAGFRLFGRPFVPDNYVLERLVYPSVGPPTRTGQFTYGRLSDGRGIRALPRGLDLMAVLGGGRARELLHELGDDAYAAGGGAPSYPQALAALRGQFARFDETDWNRNLSWSWLYALQPLLAERGDGYPPFMTGTAYRTKSLNTALAAWAHRRQDTALYALPGGQAEMKPLTETKPTRVPAVVREAEKPREAYLEPVPDLYARLLALTRMAGKGLAALGVLDESARQRVGELEKELGQALAVAEKELANEALSADEQAFLGRLLTEGYAATDTRSVVTVYSDAHTGQVLQEATGLVDVGLFVYQRPDGRLVVGAGPVLSYYEFRRARRDELTEPEWRRWLASPEPPRPPAWTRTYR